MWYLAYVKYNLTFNYQNNEVCTLVGLSQYFFRMLILYQPEAEPESNKIPCILTYYLIVMTVCKFDLTRLVYVANRLVFVGCILGSVIAAFICVKILSSSSTP